MSVHLLQISGTTVPSHPTEKRVVDIPLQTYKGLREWVPRLLLLPALLCVLTRRTASLSIVKPVLKA